jgi:hypothetical protein
MNFVLEFSTFIAGVLVINEHTPHIVWTLELGASGEI